MILERYNDKIMIQVFTPILEVPVMGSIWRYRTDVWGTPSYNIIMIRKYDSYSKIVYYSNMANMFGTLGDKLDVFHSIFMKVG